MLQAVKDGHLITWPRFTEEAINKHLKITRKQESGELGHHTGSMDNDLHLT
jgi:hypothetical protein